MFVAPLAETTTHRYRAGTFMNQYGTHTPGVPWLYIYAPNPDQGVSVPGAIIIR